MGKVLKTKEKRKLYFVFLFSLLLATMFILSGCSGEKASTVPNESANTTENQNSNETNSNTNEAVAAPGEITYESHVKDFVATKCLSCHGPQSPTMDEFNADPEKYSAIMKGPRFDSYENLIVAVNGSEAGALMRRLDDGTNREGGEPGNMYQNLGTTEEERQENLQMLKEWVGHWSLKRVAELTDEDYALFKVPKSSVKDEAAAPGEITYESHVKDFVATKCLSCHGPQSPTMDEFNADPEKYSAIMRGPRFDSYENLKVAVNGSEAGALMRRLDDGTNREGGEPGNMYQNLGDTDEERQKNLQMLKEWVGHWSLKRVADLTDEDLALFKVKEK